MMRINTINDLTEILDNGNYSRYGLRGASESDMDNLDRGYLDCSYVWENNESTGEQLNGTCALGISEYDSEETLIAMYKRALSMYAKHNGTNTVLLVADNTYDYGNDDGEVILGNGFGADVIGIVEISSDK